MKALEQDRARSYATAQSLAGGVRPVGCAAGGTAPETTQSVGLHIPTFATRSNARACEWKIAVWVVGGR
jgi:hypothetical protein